MRHQLAAIGLAGSVDAAMIDPAFIGYEPPPHSIEIEKGQVAFFAKATGDTNPIYFDEAAAQAAGHPSIPIPPTFGFSLYNMQPDPFALMNTLKVDLARMLHGEQYFEYLGLAYAGDVITLQSKVTDIYTKKNGALEFVEVQTAACNQLNEAVFRLRSLYVVKHTS